MRTSRWLVALSVVVGSIVALGAVGTAADAATSSFSAPVYRRFPGSGDHRRGRSILGVMRLGAPAGTFQVISSPDFRTWTPVTDPLPVLPAWASPGRTWAPGVIQRGSQYVMYYTTHDAALDRQCISVATSPAPSGPFLDVSAPLICQAANGGSS